MRRREPRCMFYAHVAAVPVAAVAALLALVRALDPENGAGATALARVRAIVASLVLAALVLAASISSPLT